MSNLSITAAAESAADHAAEDSLFHREVLNELIGLGSDLARMIHGQAKDQAAARYADEGVPDVTVAFERVCQTVRRTILLCRKVGEGLPVRAEARDPVRPEVAQPGAERPAEPAGAGDAAGLRCELGDRMERPECEDALPGRPVGEIIGEIRHELGLCEAMLRQADDVCARAAAGDASRGVTPARLGRDPLGAADDAAAPGAADDATAPGAPGGRLWRW
jgi:hypothetical protein